MKGAYLYSHVKALFWKSFRACGTPFVILPKERSDNDNKPYQSFPPFFPFSLKSEAKKRKERRQKNLGGGGGWLWKDRKKDQEEVVQSIILLCKHWLNRYSRNHWQSRRRKFDAFGHQRRNDQILLRINHIHQTSSDYQTHVLVPICGQIRNKDG